MRRRISIGGRVRPSVRRSVRRSVGPALFSKVKSTHTRCILYRVSGFVNYEVIVSIFHGGVAFPFPRQCTRVFQFSNPLTLLPSPPQLQDSTVDLFEKQAEEKKERVAKNELQRLRNLARASGMKKVPGIGATPSEKPSKLDLGRQFLTAKKV